MCGEGGVYVEKWLVRCCISVKKASARRRKLEEENPEMLSDTLKAQEELEKPADEFNPDDVDLETLFGGSKQD